MRALEPGAGRCTDTSINRILPGCERTKAGGATQQRGWYKSTVSSAAGGNLCGGTPRLLFFQITGGVLALGRDEPKLQRAGLGATLTSTAIASATERRRPSHPSIQRPSLSSPIAAARQPVRAFGPFAGIPCSCLACLPACLFGSVAPRPSCSFRPPPLSPSLRSPRPRRLLLRAGTCRIVATLLAAKRSRGASSLSATAKSGPSIAGFRFAFRPSPSSAFDCPPVRLVFGSSLALLCWARCFDSAQPPSSPVPPADARPSNSTSSLSSAFCFAAYPKPLTTN